MERVATDAKAGSPLLEGHTVKRFSETHYLESRQKAAGDRMPHWANWEVQKLKGSPSGRLFSPIYLTENVGSVWS